MTSPPDMAFSCLNPAIGVATTIVMSFKGNTKGLEWIWIYALFPLVGGICAVIFHELIFKKVQSAIVEQEEEDCDGILDKDTDGEIAAH